MTTNIGKGYLGSIEASKSLNGLLKLLSGELCAWSSTKNHVTGIGSAGVKGECWESAAGKGDPSGKWSSGRVIFGGPLRGVGGADTVGDMDFGAASALHHPNFLRFDVALVRVALVGSSYRTSRMYAVLLSVPSQIDNRG